MSQEPRQVLDQGREHESNGQLCYVGNDQKRLCIEGILNMSLCIGGVLRCENKRCLQANSGGKDILGRGESNYKPIKMNTSLHCCGWQIAVGVEDMSSEERGGVMSYVSEEVNRR